MRFADRRDAGRRLAERLEHLRGEDLVVLGLPRGGVPVAAEVAAALDAPLDVLVVRKIGAPGQPEFGVGAIAEGGVAVLDERTVRALGIDEQRLQEVVEREEAELARRLDRYRAGRSAPQVRERTVLVVDDGLATGVSARAALRAVAHQGARARILAVPVGAPSSIEALRTEADDVVAVIAPESMMAVGAWYDDFQQTSDEEVVELLEGARARQGT